VRRSVGIGRSADDGDAADAAEQANDAARIEQGNGPGGFLRIEDVTSPDALDLERRLTVQRQVVASRS
jgi:hypothetical protein